MSRRELDERISQVEQYLDELCEERAKRHNRLGRPPKLDKEQLFSSWLEWRRGAFIKDVAAQYGITRNILRVHWTAYEPEFERRYAQSFLFNPSGSSDVTVVA